MVEMRRLVVWNLMTLDGCFEGSTPWDLGFHQSVWGEELELFAIEQLGEIGTLLFGRKTYQGMADYWTNETGTIAEAMNSTAKAVVSRTLETADWPNTRLLSGDGVGAVRALKAEEGKDIFVFGSAELLDSLLEAGLVDEYRLCLVPVAIGGGNPLFKHPLQMRLLDVRPLTTGGVILRYALG
jgi:dihydrofolate reductase